MCNLYLIRNLLSLKAALSIENQYEYNNSIYSIINYNSDVTSLIVDNIECDNVNIKYTESLNLSNDIFGFIGNRKKVRQNKGKIKVIFSEEKITSLFITYPIHFDAYLYYRVAKEMNIKVCFFEEGPCFYRKGSTNQYKAITILDKIKRKYFLSIGIDRGYDFFPDEWYSSIPIDVEHYKVKLQYRKILLDDVRCLFLSRPVSEDCNGVSVDDEIKAITLFYQRCCNENFLYIKFHPRENENKRKNLLRLLNGNGIPCGELETNYSSEDVIYSLKESVIGGYDTTTLVYSNSINSLVKAYSVIASIKDLDTSGFLNECYNEYKHKYTHITMIYSDL